MKENIILIIKGFIIGIGKIIPGVSGALLAISLNIYDKGLDAITHFFDNVKKNFKFLLFLGIGFLLAIIIFSKFISYAITNHYLITMLLFMGLIMGGTINLYKSIKKKNYFIIVISFIAIFLLFIFNIENNYYLHNNFKDYIAFLGGGFLNAIGTVVPGISGTALLMLLGIYNLVINCLANLTNTAFVLDNLKLLLPFFLGLIMGLIIISSIMNYLLKKYKDKTYSFILGITLASLSLLVLKTFAYEIQVVNLTIGIIFFSIGLYISLIIDK